MGISKPELTAAILAWLHQLKTRPMTIIPLKELNYSTLATYVEGYLEGIGLVVGRDLHGNVQNWHNEQHKESFDMGYIRHLPRLHPKASEAEHINLLLDNVENYFRQNPNWQAEDIPWRWQFGDEQE